VLGHVPGNPSMATFPHSKSRILNRNEFVYDGR